MQDTAHKTNLTATRVTSLGGRFRWEKWATKKSEDGESRVPDSKIAESDWNKNMITNYGATAWATRALCENFVIGVIGTGVTRDVRYPTFTITPGTNIGARSTNTVKITGTNDTQLFSAGDILVYDEVCNGSYYISSRVANGADLDLVLKNLDGTEPTGTTASATPFWVYRATQVALQTEYKRSGTPSPNGGVPALESDPSTVGGMGFVSADTSGPITAGAGALATCTIASGLVNATAITADGSNYVEHSPPTVLFKGGSAGQLIVGTITSTPNDSGTITDGGSGYSNTPGDVTMIITGPGRRATFECTTTAGVVTGIEILTAGEGYFSPSYSSADTNISILDATGGGNGCEVTILPRRQAEGVACVLAGVVDDIVITYPGYKLLAAPTVTLTSTAYLVHERTWAFTVENGTVNVGEVGVSHQRTAGSNLFARMFLRNPITGASAPVVLLTGEQFRLTYQLIQNIAPAVATEVNSALVGGWGLQGGTQRYEKLGVSNVAATGLTHEFDNAKHANEPYFYSQSQLGATSDINSPDSDISTPLKAYISESTAAFTDLGTFVDRSTGLNVSLRSLVAPVITYIEADPTKFPTKVTKSASWSIAAGNNVAAIGSFGLGYQGTSGGPLVSLKNIGFTNRFNGIATAQASGDGKPEKLDTHTLTLSFEYRMTRRFAG